MYERKVNFQETLRRKSIFLFGPRQTGKSTLLKKRYPDALYINLLKNKDYQNFLRNPDRLEEVTRAYLENSKLPIPIVIIDEIQKIPALLDEVHHLIEEYKKIRFILTGSSARKLKRNGANLLGGRASWYHLHPLVYSEMGSKSELLWEKSLLIGAIPSVLDSDHPWDDLNDYIGLYLKEEIQAEGFSRSVDNFARFLTVAALTNGEQVNFTKIGNDSQIPPSTVRDYYEILEDTLVGRILPAFLDTKKRKALATAKFYLFDCGVANFLLGRKDLARGTPEYGKMLEQAIHNELRAYLDYKASTKKLEFWRSTSKFEVDFLIYSDLKDIIAIEVKAGANPSKSDYKGLLALEEEFPIQRKIVVCQTERHRRTSEDIEIMPIFDFLKLLWAGKIID